MMTKRKNFNEHRIFQDSWEINIFVFLVRKTVPTLCLWAPIKQNLKLVNNYELDISTWTVDDLLIYVQ